MLFGIFSDGPCEWLRGISIVLAIHWEQSEVDPSDTESELTPRALAAARLTIGVSSLHKVVNMVLISACPSVPIPGYPAANIAQAEVREVNQSPVWSRRTRGR